jgi:pyridoxamine 5'-phosphate oxidase
MPSAPDPIVRFRRWFARARQTDIALPEAMALATTARNLRPSVRYVLLKQVDARGFVFFTDTRSRKGRELRDTSAAAAVFYWDPLGLQVRIEGRIAEVSPAEADEYWDTRPRESRLAAHASVQSAPIAGHAELIRRWRAVGRAYGRGHVPRPPYWTGFRIVPYAIEFWTRGAHRLHKRELFERVRDVWRRRTLQP